MALCRRRGACLLPLPYPKGRSENAGAGHGDCRDRESRASAGDCGGRRAATAAPHAWRATEIQRWRLEAPVDVAPAAVAADRARLYLQLAGGRVAVIEEVQEIAVVVAAREGPLRP